MIAFDLMRFRFFKVGEDKVSDRDHPAFDQISFFEDLVGKKAPLFLLNP
jgi:hypothetical protein